MSSLGAGKGLLEVGKFAIYVSIPIVLMYTFANNSKNLHRFMGGVSFQLQILLFLSLARLISVQLKFKHLEVFFVWEVLQFHLTVQFDGDWHVWFVFLRIIIFQGPSSHLYATLCVSRHLDLEIFYLLVCFVSLLLNTISAFDPVFGHYENL